MKKKLISLALASTLLLGGCGKAVPEAPDSAPLPSVVQEPEVLYSWMAGESPVAARRMGLLRAGVNHTDHVVTPNGTYFIYRHDYILGVTPPSPWILYVDHGSDTVIKLCGRPDCPHDNRDCNAFVEGCEDITYDGGYLYAVVEEDNGRGGTNLTLLRMNPDGTQRQKLYDFQAFAMEHGADSAGSIMLTEGYFVFSTYAYKSQSGSLTSEEVGCYYYKLDGSMDAPKEVQSRGMMCYNCGDVLLMYHPEAEKGGQFGSYWDWDIATDTTTFLTDHPGEPGYYGKEQGYYFKDGAVRCLTYATGEEQVVIQTDLQGKYYAFCFPDCIVIASDDYEKIADKNFYIYNWEFQLVDTVQIRYPFDAFMFSDLLIAETAERFILTDSNRSTVPRYYIDKSELGTGNVTVHPFQTPDLLQDG